MDAHHWIRAIHNYVPISTVDELMTQKSLNQKLKIVALPNAAISRPCWSVLIDNICQSQRVPIGWNCHPVKCEHPVDASNDFYFDESYRDNQLTDEQYLQHTPEATQNHVIEMQKRQ